MKTKVCQTANLRAMHRAYESLAKRPAGVPGMAAVTGAPGTGKTTAITWLATQFDAVFLEVNPYWSPAWMLSDIVTELGARPAGRCQRDFDFIAESLAKNPRPLIFDEADRLARRSQLVEGLRTIHDRTTAPIILVGMSEFKRAAARSPQLARRITREVEFKPATLDDAKLLAGELCEIQIAEDLIADIHRRSGGSVGLIVNQLTEAESAAKRTGAKVLKLSDYQRA